MSDSKGSSPTDRLPGSRKGIRWIPLVGGLVACGVIWQVTSLISGFPAFILPPPLLVVEKFIQALGSRALLQNAVYTLTEVLAGMVLGVGSAVILGYLISKSSLLDRILAPYIVATQAIPAVAIAPLLVIWLGPGIFSKILICSLIVFFPVLVNTVVGLRSVSPNLRELMRSLEATRWQTFRSLEMPAAMPVLLGGLKIGATLSVIGAVVGEFVGSNRGLGFLINVARGQFDTALVFVGVITLAAIALGLYGMVAWAESKLLSWKNGG